MLPVLLAPADPAAPIDLALDLAFGVCDDICVPADGRPRRAGSRPTPRRRAAPASRPRSRNAPRSAAEAGVAGVTCALAPAAGGYELTAEITFAAEPGPGQVAVLEAGQPDLWIGEPESRTEGRTVTARAPVEAAGAAGPVLERRALRADRARRRPRRRHPRLPGPGLSAGLRSTPPARW